MIDFPALLQALARAEVRFIIVGGAAATAHGSARLTQDLDLVYDRSPDNLERLVTALAPHEPYLRGAPPGLPFSLDVQTLRRGLNFTLTSKLGDVDLLGEITGGGDYAKLRPHTVELELFGVRCPCLDLDKLIEVRIRLLLLDHPRNSSHKPKHALWATAPAHSEPPQMLRRRQRSH